MAAFVIGLVGSLHCVGMCGPLNLLMVSQKGPFPNFIFYHVGRVMAYTILGVFLGMIGYSLKLFNLQQILTFGLGLMLIILYGIPDVKHWLERKYTQSAFYLVIQKVLAKNLSQRNRWILSGFTNGFLPCGLTYVAAAGAVAFGSIPKGIVYMLLFGLGTLPVLALLSFGATSSSFIKKIIPRTVPFVAILSGAVLILRGFIISSPDFNQLVQEKALGLISVCGF